MLDPDAAYAKRWLLMRTKSDEHSFLLPIIKLPEDTEYAKKHVGYEL